MQILRRGMEGPDVLRWQHFLIGQKLLESAADGLFGALTEGATRIFHLPQPPRLRTPRRRKQPR